MDQRRQCNREGALRLGILGNSTFSGRLALGFIEVDHACELAVSLPKSMLPNANANASAGLSGFAALHSIPYFEVTDANDDDFHAILDSALLTSSLSLGLEFLEID
jgi:hypothetical protein